jgi:hypothetical protein
MIGERLVALAVRRERLRVRAESERRAIAERAHGLAVPLAVVDQVAGCARWLRAHPLAVLAALLAVVAVRPRGALTVAQGGLRLWAAWRALRAPRTRVAWALLPRLLDLYRGWRGRR